MAGLTMRAIRVHRFGPPEVLQCDEVPQPQPGPSEVLVRVAGAGVNPADTYGRSGFASIPEGLRPPPPSLPFTPGADLSGVVAGVGSGVHEFAVGDSVFGLPRFPTHYDAGRAYAEYATAPVGDLARKPERISHAEAGAVPMAGLTAHQYVVDQIRVEPGQTVLVNGAAGGVGHFAVQLARLAGAQVVAVASGRHRAFLADLGADEFVDYTVTPLASLGRIADVVIDTVGGTQAYRVLDVLRPGGILAPVFFGNYPAEVEGRLGIEHRGGQVRSDGARMAELARLLEAGALRVALDSTFALLEAVQAHRRVEAGHLQGKIVLTVG